MSRFQHKATIIDYNSKDWPEITGGFGVTSDLVDGRSVIGRSHTMTANEAERWAKTTARRYGKPIRWRTFDSMSIIACGIEYPPEKKES